MESLSMQKEPPQLPFSAHKKQVGKRMSFSSSSPTLLCDIYQKAHSWKVFLCRKNPPNSPLVHTKSKWEKEWPQWGGPWREMIDRDIYMCV